MEFNIGLIPGDGIGPEVVNEAVRVLKTIEEKFGHKFNFKEIDAGGVSIDKYGVPLTDEAVNTAKECDSVLLGAVGGPKWEGLNGIRPEQALLGLRGALGLYANLRPATLYPELKEACPLKDDIIGDGFDILIVRELIGGIYFGKSGVSDDGKSAFDTEEYATYEIERILKTAISSARLRKKKITVVDKANVLESSRLWRRIANEMFEKAPDIEVNYMYVDNAAMQLIKNPQQFDVIVTSNIFGDILSDEASMLTGSIGLLPSASLSDSKVGMYEPIHGSAPDIAGMGIANPVATILSAAMMLRYSLNLTDEADLIEAACKKTLNQGARTKDLYPKNNNFLSTSEMGDKIIENLL